MLVLERKIRYGKKMDQYKGESKRSALNVGMNGLDPRSAKILKDLLQDFASHGKTVWLRI